MPNTTTQKKQRIEGVLHRSLPAELTIREAAPDQTDDGLLRLRMSVSSELPYLRTSWWDEPWIEVLGHKDGEIDMVRLEGGASILANHDRWKNIGNTPLASIGAVEKAWIEGDRLLCDVVISRREALEDLRQDIKDNLVRNVSIGYQINERVLIKTNKDPQPDEYRVTSWTPFEVSLVDIPADHSVGLGRSLDAPDTQNPQLRYRVIDLSPAEGLTKDGEIPMSDKETSPAGDSSAAQATVPAAARSADTSTEYLAKDRERAREIRALARQFDAVDLGDVAIDNGISLDVFRSQLLNGMKERGTLRPAESPDIGMSERDVKQYSFCRALLAASDPINARDIAPFEMEASRAAQDKRDGDLKKDRQGSITIPFDVLVRGIEVPAGTNASVARAFMSHNRNPAAVSAFRDLKVGDPASGGNLVATELLSSSFIELLRIAMVLDRMGVTWLRGLNGNIAIPQQDGTANTYWIYENGEPSESGASIGQVPLSPKTVAAYTDYSRRLLLQSSIDVEAFVRTDLAINIGLAIQQAALTGNGTDSPTGIFNTSGIGTVIGGTNGAAPTYDHIVDLETAVANSNADVGNLAFLTNTRVRGVLRKTQEFGGTNGKPVWTSSPSQKGVGELLGYDAHVSNAIPHDFVKGASSCSGIVFGKWSDLLIGMWGGLDVMLDPYALAKSGAKRVIAMQDVDINFRHAESFAVMKDAVTK